jgi:hypothetical protein
VPTPLPPPATWRFDLTALEDCLARPAEWKARNGFPLDVLRVVRQPSNSSTAAAAAAGGGGGSDWQYVPLDRAEQALLCLVEVADEQLLGFVVRGDTWALSMPALLTLPHGAELLAPLTGDLGPEALRQAWLAWCQQRSLPGNEVDACKLEVVDHRLVVRAPERLIERLRMARSDALKGEAWLLLGTGRARLGAQVELLDLNG